MLKKSLCCIRFAPQSHKSRAHTHNAIFALAYDENNFAPLSVHSPFSRALFFTSFFFFSSLFCAHSLAPRKNWKTRDTFNQIFATLCYLFTLLYYMLGSALSLDNDHLRHNLIKEEKKLVFFIIFLFANFQSPSQ